LRVRFTEQGPLGLQFSASSKKQVAIKATVLGTQASRHPELQKGMVLISVGELSVLKLPYVSNEIHQLVLCTEILL
jgi:hypothetical protein